MRITMAISCSGTECAGAEGLTGVEQLHDKQPTAVDAKAQDAEVQVLSRP